MLQAQQTKKLSGHWNKTQSLANRCITKIAVVNWSMNLFHENIMQVSEILR